MLDMGIYVNKTVVDWMRIKLDVFEEKLTYDEALRRYRENFEKIIDLLLYKCVGLSKQVLNIRSLVIGQNVYERIETGKNNDNR